MRPFSLRCRPIEAISARSSSGKGALSAARSTVRRRRKTAKSSIPERTLGQFVLVCRDRAAGVAGHLLAPEPEQFPHAHRILCAK